uniref:Uncharacterized protein n=1 Tax=Panagrolaimus sp. ES5 TaxID=591445 RepID=A0AC34G1M7_9BILA
MSHNWHYILSNDKQLVGNDGKYSNLNLNQNYRCKTIVTSEKLPRKNRRINGNTYDKFTSEKFFRINSTKEVAFPLGIYGNQSKKEKLDSTTTNSDFIKSSTLSLHIAAYENSVETSNECNEEEFLKKNSAKHIFVGLSSFFVQVSFT